MGGNTEVLGYWLLALILSLGIWQANYSDWESMEEEFVATPFTESDYQAVVPKLRQAGLLSTDEALLRRVQAMSAALVTQAQQLYPAQTPQRWNVLVLRGEDNAFVIGAGKIAVGEELIRNYQLSDDELAMVLSHEFAHLALGHEDRMHGMLVQHHRLAAFTKIVTGTDPADSLAMDLWLLSRLLPQKRQMEVEADRAAVGLAAAAGYDPAAFLSLMDKIAADEPEGVPGWMRDHPTVSARKLAIRPDLAQQLVARHVPSSPARAASKAGTP